MKTKALTVILIMDLLYISYTCLLEYPGTYYTVFIIDMLMCGLLAREMYKRDYNE